MNVTLYSFAKRENSTEQPPSGVPGYTYDCKLKEETSIITPHIIISKPQGRTWAEMIGFNYCYISEFFRYYFIRDNIILNANQIEYVLEVDALGTFKTQITSGSHYVLRSASNYDEYIQDTAYVGKVNETGQMTSGSVDGSTIETDPFAWSNGHSYILGIVGNVSSTYQFGSVAYYWLDDTELTAFTNYLMQDVSIWSGISTSEFSTGMQAALINPSQYIVSAIALPFSKPSTQGVATAIKFGYYTYNIGGNIHMLTPSTCVKAQSVAFTLPKHPQANTRGKYMNGAPFTRYIVHLSPFGDIPIDPAGLIDDTGLQVNIRTDLTTGIARIWIAGSSNSSNRLYTGSAQVGVPINITQVLRDPLGEVTSLGNAIGGVASSAISGNAVGIVSSYVNGIGDAIRSGYPSVMGGGAAGSQITFHDDSGCYLQSKFYTMADECLTEIGRPLCQTKTLSTLSGFCICQNADVSITGTKEEANIINGYLNGGFFIE